MKTYKFLQFACVVALMGAAAGCADDAWVQTEDMTVSTKGQPITLQASVSGDASRVQYHEGEQKMTMTWESDDVLKVVNPNNEALITDFRLVEGAGKSFASFEGTPEVAFNDGDALYALYHNDLVESQFNEDGNLVLSLKEQDGTLNKNYQLMFGETTYQEGAGLQTVQLSSLVSILKLTIPTNKTLKQVTLGRNQFRSKATLILKGKPANAANLDRELQIGDMVYCYNDDEEEQNGEITAKGTFVPDENGVVTVYFYILPARRYIANESWLEDSAITFTFTAIDENNEECVNLKEFDTRGALEPGKMYKVSSPLFSFVDFDDMENSDGLSEEKPYKISDSDQLYSLMMRVRRGYTLRGTSYEDFHYKLTKDIELDGSVEWRGINLYGSFDGDGHTISGSVSNSFIGELFGGTIKNLILDLDFAEDISILGTLLTRAYGGNIINCVNQSDFTSKAGFVGGLVGDIFAGAKMIACGNTGNVTAIGEGVERVGGLVGSVSGDSSVEGCYSTGQVTSANNDSHIGGLIGAIETNEDNKPRVVGCWTSVEDINIVGNGTENINYSYCYKSASIATIVDDLNRGLATVGSMCRFNEQGLPYINTTSSGTGSGSNFGNGGEF